VFVVAKINEAGRMTEAGSSNLSFAGTALQESVGISATARLKREEQKEQKKGEQPPT